MVDRANGTEGRDEPGNLVHLHASAASSGRDRQEAPVTFSRRDLEAILRLYGRMVAAGEWRDYAIDHLKDSAVFSVYRRTSETPLYRIARVPALAARQGAWSVTGANGQVLKRGHELERVLQVFDKTLRLVEA